MLKTFLRRRVCGFTLIEVMAVTSIMAGAAGQGGYQYAINQANQTKGISNLKQIYQLLLVQTIGEELPKAAFYPQGDPKTAPDSIVRLIQGAPKELFVSPFAPDALKAKGLTFAWNDSINGKSMELLPKDTWLLIDMAAFIADPKIPRPTKYLILYADGRADAVINLPEDIQKVVEEAKGKLKE